MTLGPERAADVEACRAAAVTLLARRDFAGGELRRRLEGRGFEAETAAQAVAALIEERALDDARYAQNYVAYHAGRGQGSVRIAADLSALGLAAALVEAALASGPDWRALARDVRARKFGVDPPDSWPEKARQARFLQYRGFSSDHIRFALGSDPGLDT
ncbi:MAG: regulatory protein RecX [Steroidobacteraceae bacterium]